MREAPTPRVLAVLLAHQPPGELTPFLRAWDHVAEPGGLLVAYGGTAENFRRLEGEGIGPSFFVGDPRLRTRDHQRERQSYQGIFRGAAEWLTDPAEPGRGGWTHVHVVEFDHLPLVPDLHARQVARLRAEHADVLAHRLLRIDGTSHPHYLYHAHGPEFGRWLHGFSRRSPGERDVVLSMLGTGSIWTREAFLAMAAVPEPFPIYLELWLPTVAHHLGFRVRPFQGPATECVHHLGTFSEPEVERARRAGAWTAHPVKRLR